MIYPQNFTQFRPRRTSRPGPDRWSCSLSKTDETFLLARPPKNRLIPQAGHETAAWVGTAFQQPATSSAVTT